MLNTILDDPMVDAGSFAYQCMTGVDRWLTFTPVFGSLTIIGATTYLGRYRALGHGIQAQVRFSAATSIASVAGTDYLTLPIAAKGLSGFGVMTNDTAKTAVGLCHLDAANSKLYLPTQVASGNTFNLFFEYEI